MDQGPLESVRSNAGFVRQLAGALARDDHEADDVAQDALARALPPPRGLAMDLRSWLAGVTRNVFRMRRRTEARRLRRERRAARPEDLPSAADQAARLELLERIVAALADLEEPYRSTVVLRYYDGYSPPEIARLTRTPLNTVKTRLRRGLSRLRASLGRGTHGSGDLRGALLLLAGRRAPRAGPTAVAGVVSFVLTGAFLMSTKFKAALAVLVLLSLSTTLLLLPSGPTGRAPTPADAGGDALPLVPVDSSEDGAAPDAAPATGPATPGTPADPPGAADGVVEGRVLDREGRPVVGLEFTVSSGGGGPMSVSLRAVYGASGLQFEAMTPQVVVTDGEGRFRAEGLPRGRARILIEKPEYARFEMVVDTGGEPIQLRLDPGFAIAGRVIDAATGLGILRMPVWIRPADDPRAPPNTVLCEADGSFRFEGIGEGAWTLRTGFDYLSGTKDWEDYRLQTVTPVEAGTTDLVLSHVRGHRIEGTVYDSEGNPVPAGIRVELTGMLREGRLNYSFRRYTDTLAGGVFRLGGLRDSTYHLAVRPATAADPRLGLTLSAVDASGVPAGTHDLVIRMSRGRTIAGRLENDLGEAVEHRGILYVYPSGGEPGSPGTVMAICAEDGTFCTSPLSDTITWDIYATSVPGHGSVVRKQVFVGSDDVVITLPRTRRITGLVRDEEGKPVAAGVPVLARADGIDPNVDFAISVGYTNASGEFAVEKLGDFVYSLRAGAGDTSYRVSPPVTGVRPGEEGVTLQVEKGLEFSGRLLDADGRPVHTDLIQASRPDDEPWLPNRTAVEDDEGRFTLRGLRPGKLKIWAYLDGVNVLLGEFDVPARDVEIRLPPK